jgi:TolB-like protein/tetratricopeptide (TPR) repeat protein
MSAQHPPRWQALLADLKRRRVFRVMAVYGVVGFVVLQAADLLVPVLLLPDWTYRFIGLALLVGFPIAIALAWAFELTPEGVRRTEPPRTEELAEIVARPRRQRWSAGLLALAGATLLVGGAWFAIANGTDARGRSAVDAAAAPSLVVLPFVNTSADEDQEYFSDGLTEELLNALVAMRGLRVAARTSSFAFKGQNVPVDEVARRLNVSHVLEGSVRRSGERLRITAQLISAADGFHLWSQTYDRHVEDVFDVQEEISRAIVLELRGRLGPDVRLATIPTRTTDPETYDVYLRGRFHWRRGTRQDLEEALLHFQRAVARDSTFALAWVGLADTYQRLANWNYVAPRDALRLASAAARRAVALDSLLAPARSAYGHSLRWWDHDRIAARREHQRALELQPDLAEAHERYAWFLVDEGRIGEAIEHYRRAAALDPYSPSAVTFLGSMLLYDRRFDEALAQFERAGQIPGNPRGGYGRARALYLSGRVEEAIAQLEAVTEANASTRGFLGYVYAMTGRQEDARRLLAELKAQSQHEYVPAMTMAHIHVGLGEYDAALDELDHAWRQGSLAPELNALPEFAPLHGRPRYQALLRKLGLETGRGERP